MLLLAALSVTNKLTTWEKMQNVPKETWISCGVAILVLVVIIKLWRNLREVGEVVPWIVFILFGGTVILYWTYERTEPKVLAPIFDQLSRVLPSKIEYKEAPLIK